MNDKIPLGKPTSYSSTYDPKLLFPIARSEKRDELAQEYLKFAGKDIWNAFEISWLNRKGKPVVAIGVFEFDASSKNIIESKSFKLYLNSFNQSQFDSSESVIRHMQQDLSAATQSEVVVTLTKPKDFKSFQIGELEGTVLDELDASINQYDYAPDILASSRHLPEGSSKKVSETLVSHLLKSNCLITNQPDWASIQIKYHGLPINHEALLKYLVSFRTHNEFHEQCVERIFADIKHYCQPEKLTVYARYTRRGGLDINPWRSDFEDQMINLRLARQ